jgi:hypothetical protein
VGEDEESLVPTGPGHEGQPLEVARLQHLPNQEVRAALVKNKVMNMVLLIGIIDRVMQRAVSIQESWTPVMEKMLWTTNSWRLITYPGESCV